MKIYGPYLRKDNRRMVVLVGEGIRTTMSYARWLFKKEHGDIPDHLCVDHIDENKTNDTLSNYQLLTREENAKKSAKKTEIYKGTCPVCEKEFEKPAHYVRSNRKQNKEGPFCSRRCAGKYNARMTK